MVAIAMGLISAIFLGFADFLATQNSRRIGAQYSLAGMLFTSTIVITIYFLITGDYKNLLLAKNLDYTVMGILHGIFMALALLLFFYALSIGKVFIVAPIVAAHPVFIVLIYMIMGKKFTIFRLIAIFFVITGVVIVGFSSGKLSATLVKKEKLKFILTISLISSFLYAVSLLALQHAALILSGTSVLWLARFFGFLTVIIIILVKNKLIFSYGIKSWLVFILHGFLDSIGLLLIILGTNGSQNDAIILVVSSIFPVITIILAWFILKERMNFFHLIGIKLIIISIGYLTFLNHI